MAGTAWVRQEIVPVPAEGWGWRAALGVSLPQSADAPLFAALADQWRAAGRMVPGQRDEEWSALVGGMARFIGV